MKRSILGIVVIIIFAAVFWSSRTTDRPEVHVGASNETATSTVNPTRDESKTVTKKSINQALTEQTLSYREIPLDTSSPPNPDTILPASTESPSPEQSKDAAVGIQKTISAYLQAGLTGDKEAAAKVAAPNAGGSVVEDVADLQEIWSESEDFSLDIYANDSAGLAVSNLVLSPWENQPSMYLVFTFQKESDGNWYISDIDADDFDRAEKQIERFLENNDNVHLTEGVAP